MPPEPILLAVDTSAAHCAAALLQGDRLLGAACEPMEKGQAERLMPLLEEVLAGAGLGWGDLAALAVGTGPGNFTGVRIAVAAARGLALALRVPALGVTRFEARAHGLPRPIAVAEHARRGEVFVQELGPAEPLGAARLGLPGDLDGISAPYVTGDAAAEIAGRLPGAEVLAARWPLAEGIARVALARLGTDQPRPAPFYLRGADAAPPSDPPPVILPDPVLP